MMIKDLKDIKREEIDLFGGKAVNLGILLQNGFNIPSGFCISTQVNKLTEDVKDKINQKLRNIAFPVAVRSSATAEDSRNSSFAGQFKTFLDINSEKELFAAIEKCWNSLNSKNVQAYLKNKNIKNVKMAIIVQKMVNVDYGGVVFTIDPIEKKNILIEVVEGSGEKLVAGEVTPNTYHVDRKDFSIIQKEATVEFDENLLIDISKTALKIEKLFNYPQDIEFCLKDRELFILQSRPITTL